MDHPSKEWQNLDIYPTELKAERRKELNKHIHFKGLRNYYDYMCCFFWEYHRTVAFLEFEYDDTYSERDRFFPFTEDSFPLTPYLSHPLATRRSWFKTQGEEQSKDEEKLLSPFGGIDQEIEIGEEKLVRPIFDIPLTLYVNPNLGLEEFVRLIREQWTDIEKQIQKDVRSLKEEGRDVIGGYPTRNIVSVKHLLKLLGVYRLYHCVGLCWGKTREEYGLKKNASEDRFRSDCNKNLSLLSLS